MEPFPISNIKYSLCSIVILKFPTFISLNMSYCAIRLLYSYPACQYFRKYV